MPRRLIPVLLALTVAIGLLAGSGAAAAQASKPKVTLKPSTTTVNTGEELGVRGKAARTPKGIRVVLQVRAGGSWVRLLTTKTGKGGRFKAKTAFTEPGTVKLRAKVAKVKAAKGKRKALPARTSKAVTITVTTRPIEPITDVDALVAIYQSTGGDGWTRRDGWLAHEDYCDWYGVTCTDGVVTGLSLNGNNLTGTLPAEIGALAGLTKLNLTENPLVTGGLPAEIGQLTRLEELWLGGFKLPDGLPAEIGELSSLRWLYLTDNDLTSLPPEIGDLTSLRQLFLSYNEGLTTIPAELGQLAELTTVELTYNALTGDITDWASGLRATHPDGLDLLLADEEGFEEWNNDCLTVTDDGLAAWLDEWSPDWDECSAGEQR